MDNKHTHTWIEWNTDDMGITMFRWYRQCSVCGCMEASLDSGDSPPVWPD